MNRVSPYLPEPRSAARPLWWRLRHWLAHLTHLNGCFGMVRAKLGVGGGWEYGVTCKGCGLVEWLDESHWV